MAKTKRLLLVTNRLATGGAEHMLITLARLLDRHRVVPRVACLQEPGPLACQLETAGVPVHAYLSKHKADVLAVDRLARLIRRESIDAICAVGSGGDRMFWSTLAARQTGTPLIVWSHVYPYPGHPGFERTNRFLYRCVDCFVALGRRHRLALVRREHIPAGRVTVIRNGIQVERFDRPDLRAEGRQRLGLSDSHAVAVGIVANLRPDKRHDVFIRAASRIARERPGAVFFIIGGGPGESTVRRLITDSGLTDMRLRFLGEQVDLPILIQGLDIVCLCSEWQECLSVVMLEAMAAGRAFIGPAIGSLDEALIDGHTGRMIPPADSLALAKVLAELISDSNERLRLGRNARDKVKSEFRADQMAKSFENLVGSLCASHVESRCMTGG